MHINTVITHLSNCDQIFFLKIPIQLAANLLLSTVLVGGTVAVGPTASSSCNDSRAVLRAQVQTRVLTEVLSSAGPAVMPA
jgi:hypothetical protein